MQLTRYRIAWGRADSEAGAFNERYVYARDPLQAKRNFMQGMGVVEIQPGIANGADMWAEIAAEGEDAPLWCEFQAIGDD